MVGAIERAVGRPFDEATPAGWVGGEAPGQVLPTGSTAEHPQHAFQAGAGVSTGPTALRARLGWLEQVANHRPLLVAELRTH